ncbi:MAG: translation initiation factor IF-2 [Elusimicrobia bacterium]|nr:translation initiation factor IF-2 [Elusimicrobiota bacterium]
MRIHELAKRLNVECVEIFDLIEKAGLKVKRNVSAGLDKEEVARVEALFKGKSPVAVAPKEEKKESPAKKSAKRRKKSEAIVFKLARELGATSAALIEKLESIGITGKKPNSGLTSEEVEKIKQELFRKKSHHPAAVEAKKEKEKPAKEEEKGQKEEKEEPKKNVIKIDASVTVGALAQKLGMTAGELIKKLLKQGIITTINQRLDLEIASLIIQEEGFEPEIVDLYKDKIESVDDRDSSRAVPRPPVVTVMGHVDHGKTTLLDFIRKSHIVKKEHGNITQHIGAYQIKHKDSVVTFLDTPGHEAFTAMRLRGAQVTDIVVLVVDAVDGVMPQTSEAISHARLAGVEIIVAINKIDLPAANIEKVKQQLAGEHLVPEDWGGKTIVVPISAKTGEGVDDLLDMIVLQAEMMHLKADPACRARGVVLEAKLDPRRGALATVLVTEGTLKIGDPFVCGFTGGKVRALYIEGGRMSRSVSPGTPVEVMGFSSVAEVGDSFVVVASEALTRKVVESRRQIQESMKMRDAAQKQKDEKALNIILKADVGGSAEAIKDALSKLSNPEVKLNIVHSACGGLNKSDVLLAQASGSMIVAFNVKGEDKVLAHAQQLGVDVRTYTVIYNLIDDIKKALEGRLAPAYKEIFLGRAEVKKIFNVSKVGTIAGCIVTAGKIAASARVRLLRDNAIVYTGKINSLKRFQDSVSVVSEGMECGILLEKFNDLKPADIIEAYQMEKIQRSLEDAAGQE